MASTDDDDTVPWIAHDEFRAGLRHGRWRIVVNPQLARPFIVQRTRVDVFALAFIGAGAVLALSGSGWSGLALVVIGMAASRLTRAHAPRLLLHLAERDAGAYRDATRGGVMEVRRA
jgi:hypothetical protein